jgi:proteasome accessory factor B
MPQLDRIFWTDARIRQNAYPNADSLAAEFEISRRQAFQDHAFLRDRLNAPIAYSRARRGWYYTDPTYVLPAMRTSNIRLSSVVYSRQ